MELMKKTSHYPPKAKKTMKEKKLKETIDKLKKVKSILKLGNVKFWLMSGTLLGCIQRGGILPNDRDVDLGSQRNQMDKFDEIVPELEKEGLKVEKRLDPVALRLKGMYTIRGSGMPIDIKFLDQKRNFMFRSIHKNDSYVAKVLWGMADIMYLGEGKIPGKPRISKYARKTAKVTPKKIRHVLKNILCKLWLKSESRYGFVVFPKRYFENMKVKKLHGIEFKVPQESKKYIKEEYGEEWSEHNPSGRGGWEKPSHIIIEEEAKSELDYESLVNKAIKKRVKDNVG